MLINMDPKGYAVPLSEMPVNILLAQYAPDDRLGSIKDIII